MVELIDLIVTNLFTAASTETGRRLVGAGFDALGGFLDPDKKRELARVVAGRDHNEIKDFLRENEDFVEPAAEVAQQTIERSYVFPYESLSDPTPEHKVALFREVIEFGFSLSKRFSMDVLLPGSLVGLDTITLFSSGGTDIPELPREHVKLRLPVHGSMMCIIPVFQPTKPVELCNTHRSTVIKARNEDSHKYLEIMHSEKASRYKIEKLSAGGVYFYLTLYIPNETKSILGMVEDRVELGDWKGGIDAMLSYVPELLTIGRLSPEEGDKLRDAGRKLRETGDVLSAFKLPS